MVNSINFITFSMRGTPVNLLLTFTEEDTLAFAAIVNKVSTQISISISMCSSVKRITHKRSAPERILGGRDGNSGSF